MKHTILFLLFAATVSAQDTIRVDTVQTSPTIQKALPELIEAREQLEKQLKDNTEKLMLIISAYVDPRNFVGFTEDKKSLIIKAK